MRRSALSWWLSATGVVLAIVLLLGGCGKGREQGRATKEEISIFLWVRPDELKANQQLKQEFERLHPGLKVKIVNDPAGQAMAKLKTLIAGGEPPDVMSLHGAFFVPLADEGALADLAPFAEGDPDLNLSDFYPGLLELCNYEGKLYSLPRYTSVYTLFYNKTMFTAAGEAFPTERKRWDWEEFLRVAQALTKDTNGDGKMDQYGCAIDFTGARVYPWIWQNNGELVTSDRTRTTLDTPGCREALQFLVDLKDVHHVTPEVVRLEFREGIDLFKSQRVSMYQSGPWDVQELKGVKEFDWDIAPLPKGKRPATLLGTENYAISSRSRYPREAWELLKFLLSPESQRKMALELGKMPSRRSVAEEEFLDSSPRHDLKVCLDAIDYAVMPPNLPNWEEVGNVFNEQLGRVWAGRATVAQGCREAQQKMNAILARGSGPP